jgi:hypothetical protein
MNLKDFISDALSNSTDLIAYDVSRKLQQLFADRAVIEGAIWSFDLADFVRAGHCTVVAETSLYNKARMELSECGKSFVERPENAWFNVLWRGNLLDVLLLTWHEEGCRERHHWIIAETRQIAEEFLAAVCDWGSEVRGEILVFEGGYWSKNQELFTAIASASFENLILPGNLEQEIRQDFARFFGARETYEQYGIPWKRGVLLIGPPGNGKTHTVKALVNEVKRPCLYVKSFKGWYGTDHDRIRRVFNQARKCAPCIVVLEDLDSLIDNYNRSFILNELDGFAENTGIVVLATTNHADRLDPAILDRPSRFDRKYYFELPSAAGRLAYFERWRETVQAELSFSDKTLQKIVARTKGFSFAYLKELCVSAMMAWMADRSTPMDKVLRQTASTLRAEMKSKSESKSK